MDLKEKVEQALGPLQPEYVRLVDEDGITGFIVSRTFDGVTSLERQRQIDRALDASPTLSREERRKVVMIAALTPPEYDSVGAPIEVHQVKQLANGAVEIVLRGAPADAEYVRGALNNQKGIRTTDPKPFAGGVDFLISFRARGTAADPLTRDKALRILKHDRYIAVVANA